MCVCVEKNVCSSTIFFSLSSSLCYTHSLLHTVSLFNSLSLSLSTTHTLSLYYTHSLLRHVHSLSLLRCLSFYHTHTHFLSTTHTHTHFLSTSLPLPHCCTHALLHTHTHTLSLPQLQDIFSIVSLVGWKEEGFGSPTSRFSTIEGKELSFTGGLAGPSPLSWEAAK